MFNDTQLKEVLQIIENKKELFTTYLSQCYLT